ncbi:MAG: hypothetical protein M1818_008414 [Claussenomyces sp. TS43310]|nr:MAG: hypothetical protein M1818_008414 [Claussenomyces sp. TS43310]
MAGRGVAKALRRGESTLETATRSKLCHRRTFISTSFCQRHGAVPEFSETTSSELDDVLSTFRSKVFLPAHLSKAHRDLIYGSKNRKVLDEDPLKVEIAGEEFYLGHLDRTKDQPNSAKGLLQAVTLMKDKKDWDNLPIFFEGLKTAKRTIKTCHLEKVVRKAGNAGRQDTILECARRVSKTGFALKDAGLVREIMWWLQYKAASSTWDPSQTQKALSMAEQVAILLEDERHSGQRVVKGIQDVKIRPEVVGILLELAAAHAKQKGTGDADGKVTTYADKLISIMKDDRDLRTALPVEDGWDARNNWLRFVSPIIYGLRTAGEVLENASTRKELFAIASILGDRAAKERELLVGGKAAEKTSLGLWAYTNLVGSKS